MWGNLVRTRQGTTPNHFGQGDHRQREARSGPIFSSPEAGR
jgi:hypothetical protein